MDSFHILPIGSIYSREEKASIGYLDIVQNLPLSLRGMTASTETASYIKGLSRTYDIPEEKQPSIAFAILELSIGKKTFDQIPAVFSTELGLSPDKAQKMASEIEKDIFGPVKRELDEFLQGQKGTRTTVPAPTLRLAPLAQGKPPTSPQNLLDLKEITAAKKQEQLAAKPQQRSLPPRTNPSPLPAGRQASPLPEQERGTAPVPKFPLPPRTAMP